MATTTTTQTPVQDPYSAWRQGLPSDYLNTATGGKGVGDFASQNPWAITPEQQPWLNSMQDFAKTASGQLTKNPFDYTPGTGFANNPILDQGLSKLGNVSTMTAATGTAPTVGPAPQADNPYISQLMGDAPDWLKQWMTAEGVGKMNPYIDQLANYNNDAISYGVDALNAMAPGISSMMSAQGLGRGGAAGQALAREGSQMMVPIAIAAGQQRENALANAAGLANQNLTFGANAMNNRNIAGAQLAGQQSQFNANASLQDMLAQAQLQGQFGLANMNNTQASNMFNANANNTMNTAAANAMLNLGQFGPQFGLQQLNMVPGMMNLGFGAASQPSMADQKNFQNQQQMLLALLGVGPQPGTTTTVETPTNWSGIVGGGLTGLGLLGSGLGALGSTSSGGTSALGNIWDWLSGSGGS